MPSARRVRRFLLRQGFGGTSATPGINPRFIEELSPNDPVCCGIIVYSREPQAAPLRRQGLFRPVVDWCFFLAIIESVD
jgi:hypothetical protein